MAKTPGQKNTDWLTQWLNDRVTANATATATAALCIRDSRLCGRVIVFRTHPPTFT